MSLFHITRCTVIAALMAVASPGRAEPFLAVQNGFKCSQCHVNRTGGGKRNDFGSIFTQTMLPRKFLPGTPFQKDLTPSIKTGANFRFESLTRFAYSMDTSGTGATQNREPPASNLGIPEGNIYGEFNLIQNYLTVYLDHRVSPAPESREAFILAQSPKTTAYVKAGKMLQPFGWRVYDDEGTPRKTTQFTYANPRTGVEVGWEPGKFSLAASLTESQVSATAIMLLNGIPRLKSMRLGGSGYRTHAGLDQIIDFRDQTGEYGFGAFWGWGIWKLALLAEGDAKRAYENGREVWKQFGMVEANLLATRGLNLRLGLDWLNPDTDASFRNNGQSRVVLGAEFFPVQYLEFGAYYHFRQAVPDNFLGNPDELRLQIHAFY